MKDERIALLQKRSPLWIRQTIESANAICDHRINLFGGTFYVGKDIDWHRDVISGHRWPLKFSSDIEIINLDDHSDVKYPWELNRFFHAVVLGEAYWLTEDEKYAREFVSQLRSWTGANPLSRGINWSCAMEVAIRAVNLIWSYCFFADSSTMTTSVHSLFFNLIISHGRFIRQNLENVSSIQGNHYIANLVGLLYIACFLPTTRLSRRWKSLAIKELRRAMGEQVNVDGTTFEASIPYHGFVAEMFFHAAFLLTRIAEAESVEDSDLTRRQRCADILGDEYVASLERMCEFIVAYIRPDGQSPQIGDNDDSRLVRFSGNRGVGVDHRHVLATSANFFGREDFRSVSGYGCEESIWLWGYCGVLPSIRESKSFSRAFNDGGFHIIRDGHDYLIVHCADLGTAGKGTHSHNDSLSFELCMDGLPFIIDPGSYAYSRDPQLRNHFRSTRAHNTIFIDHQEQNNFDPRDLFRLRPNSKSKVIEWKTDADSDVFAGECTVHARRGTDIVHRRRICFDKKTHEWEIRDTVSGDGVHSLEWNFHAADGVKIHLQEGKILFESWDTVICVMSFVGLSEFTETVENSWYSPNYSVKRQIDVLRIAAEVTLPIECVFRLNKIWRSPGAEQEGSNYQL